MPLKAWSSSNKVMKVGNQGIAGKVPAWEDWNL